MITDRTSAIYDSIAAFQRTHRLPGLQHAQIRGLLAEHLARALPAAPAVVPSAPVDRERVAAALYRHEWPRKQVWQQALAMDRETFLAQADAVLAVLPAPVDRGAVEAEAAYRIRAELVCCRIYDRVNDTGELTFEQALKSRDWHDLCYWGEAAARLAERRPDGKHSELRRMADEAAAVASCPCRCPCYGCKHHCAAHDPDDPRCDMTAEEQPEKPDRCPHGCDTSTCPCLACEADEEQQPETQALAPMFEGLARLIATSSRDWGQYRVDAWLWAVLVGWDCEEDEHDETCTHGAMEEMQEQHGWDDDTVTKARRYRAMVRAITEPAAVAQPGKEA